MLAAGLIEEAGERPDPELNDERRRYYSVTAQGKQAAEEETNGCAHSYRPAKTKAVTTA